MTIPPEDLKVKNSGFGYYNAKDFVPQPDDTRWIIKDVQPKGFGFTAGLPKGSNSPHGGKSVWFKAKAFAILNQEDFLGNKIMERGKILSINLDEEPPDQIRNFRNLCNGEFEKGENFYVSKIHSNFPLTSQMCLLDMDIKELKPFIVGIDPLLRCMSGKDINKSSDTGPIIDRLKKCMFDNQVTMEAIHHCLKNPERDKESSSTWLNGSIDLDSAWDYLHAIEWVKGNKKEKWDLGYMHARIFTRKCSTSDIFYTSIKEGKNITGLIRLPEEIINSATARLLYSEKIKDPTTTYYKICSKFDLATTSAHACLSKYEALKLLYSDINNHVRVISEK